ncbi:MAG: SPFH domain-containing protein [Planctomycetota bacterium]|jgi:uncharacterized membrane protein YqiK
MEQNKVITIFRKMSRRTKIVVSIAGTVVVIIILLVFVSLFTITGIGEEDVGLVSIKLGDDLPPGRVIAINHEKGPQAWILGPGYHFFYWPWRYSIKKMAVTEVNEGNVGILTSVDGKPLPPGQTFAPEWSEAEFGKMLDSQYFLTEGGGYKGPQTSVLPPGAYRLNTEHFRVKVVPAMNIEVGKVGVIKSNVGKESEMGTLTVPDRTYRGIVSKPLSRGMYYLNTDAFEVNRISVQKETLSFNPLIKGEAGYGQITVRSQDGFEAPIDVDVIYQIREENAPEIVARFVDNAGIEKSLVRPTIRAEFRNAAGKVPMLNFILQREQQEKLVLSNLKERLLQHKVEIHEVYIRDIDFSKDPQLAALLKTQTDREIADQQKDTYIRQQETAMEEKILNRKAQEALEEKKVVIAEQKIIIAEQEADAAEKKADGEARAIERIAKADASKELEVGKARAEAYSMLVKELGKENIALLEFLKEIASGNIKVVPDVSVSGSQGSLLDALIGSFLKQQKDGKKE